MPTIPTSKTLTATSVDVLNVIRNNASVNYQNYVPVATPDADSIKTIGNIIMDNPSLQNEFLNSLANRIGKVIITSKVYDNPWSVFKKGLLELGETIEEIFVNIAKPFEYDPVRSENDLFKQEKPDVRSAFHVMNYTKQYKSTVRQDQLRQAFLSWTGITDLIGKIIDAMYTGANYDEFLTMKYLLARHILNGQMKVIEVPPIATENMNKIVSTIKSTSNKLTFLSTDYNIAGVENTSAKADQYIIVNSDFDAIMDVEVLASAFNMDKAEFAGKRILVDSFGELDAKRLSELFAGNSGYTPLTDAELKALDQIPATIVDADFFMIYDNLMEFNEVYNPAGLYWNYFYHVWKTFSVSPFANNALFVPATPSVTSVAVTPETATVGAGQNVTLSANVVTENFASMAVDWTTSDEAIATVTKGGLVTVSKEATTGATVTITATSVFDDTKTATCVITVA